MRGGAVAARRAHNPKVAGSSPAPATNKNHDCRGSYVLRPAHFVANPVPCYENKRPLKSLVFVNLISLKIKLPLAIWRCIDTRGFSNTLVHGHIGKWFAENAIVNGP